jgi:hypothetical protein
MTQRAVPYLCPFCGEENLRPIEAACPDDGARWECRSCLRVFSVTFHGLSRPGSGRGPALAMSGTPPRPWNPDSWGGSR